MSDKFIIYKTAKICRTLQHGKVGDISDFVFCNAHLRMGERSHIATGVRIVGAGTVYIGDDVQIGPNVVIYTTVPDTKKQHIGKYDSRTQIKKGDVRIGNNVFIGAQSVIPQGSIVPDNTIIKAFTYWRNNKV